MSGYFELFGLEPRFAVDVQELERRYLERSKLSHPDRFATQPASQRVAALQASMQLNEAYGALRKPVARAEYLLSCHGVTIGANEQLDPTFLMDVLEARERLAAAKQAGDRDQLAALEDAMLGQRADAIARLDAVWSEFERDGDRAVLDRVKRELILLRYLARYLEQFDDEES